MNTVLLDFKSDPSSFAASYIRDNEFLASRTLVVTPTERFKVYLARAFLDSYGTEDAMAPAMMKIGDLVETLAACTGHERANGMQRLSLLYRACAQTGGFDELFGRDILSSFASFRSLASGLLGSFEEINRMEIDLTEPPALEYYDDFGRHFEIFSSICEGYRTIQKQKGLYDTSFLLKDVKSSHIEAFFAPYDNVIFISPLLLTRFERRVFDLIEDRLHVIYQETDEYDFSDLITLRGNVLPAAALPEHVLSGHHPSASHSDSTHGLFVHDTSTRIETAMLVMSLIRRERDRGVKPHEIAVLNIDPAVCEMVRRSCESLGLASNYTRGVMVKKAPVFVFLELAGAFFDSRMDTDVLLELVRSEFFCELAGRREKNVLRERIVSGRVFSLGSLKSGLLDAAIREALLVLQDLYGAKDFDELYEGLLSLFGALGGRRPFEFYTVRDLLLESVLELSDLLSGGRISLEADAVEFTERPYDIFLQYGRSKRYTLKGSITEGVQIVGLLETRGVTFKTVIVPTFNEGYFPTGAGSDLLFSSELKRALGLSTVTDRERLEFYYLKRLLDASDRAYLIPIRESAGEFEVPSRFCHIMRARKGTPLSYTLPVPERNPSVKATSDRVPVLKERPESYSRLDIHRLKRCETQYYIAKTLRIESERVLTKRVEMDVVGLLVHGLLRDLYAGFDFENLPSRADFKKRIRGKFYNIFRDGLFGTSEEVLARRILLENLSESLLNDYDRFEKGTVVCGDLLEREFTVQAGDYRLKGRIDRIDRAPDGRYTVLDYKTGNVPKLTDHLPGKDYMEVQLGFYGLLFKKSFPDRSIGGLGYYDLSRTRDVLLVMEGDEAQRYIDRFEEHLRGFIETFEKKEGLSLAPDMTFCLYCPYYNICRVYDA